MLVIAVIENTGRYFSLQGGKKQKDETAKYATVGAVGGLDVFRI